MSETELSFTRSVTAPGVRRRGLMLVLSSPSGAGKSTISQKLIKRDDGITLSISVTTRPPRVSEIEGVHYHFVGQERFDSMIQNDEFLEYARVFGNSYGTPKAPVLDALAEGRDMLFDVDWQGTQQLAASARDDLVSVFLLPPSLAELERRLRGRAEDSEEVVQKRMAKAADEMSHYPEYDYTLVNSDVEECVRAVEAILAVERLKRHRQIGLPRFVAHLRGEE